MTADVELLPLYAELQGHPKLEIIKHYARANVTHATAAKDAVIVDLQSTIEALRTEVERLKALVRSVGHETLTRAEKAEARAERLAEALRIAIRQNSHDMLMTGDELRQCEAAISPTAAQGDEAASA